MWCILAAAAPEFAQPCSKMNSIFSQDLGAMHAAWYAELLVSVSKGMMI